MPSDFSIRRKLMPQRQRADSDTVAPLEPKTHWLQPKPLFSGRRSSTDPALIGGTESHREIPPVPMPDAAYSFPDPPFARQSRDFSHLTGARTGISPVGSRRSVSPARSMSVPEVREELRPPTPVFRTASLPSPLAFEVDQAAAKDEGVKKAGATPVLRPESPAQRPSRPSTPVRLDQDYHNPTRPLTPPRPERPAHRPSSPLALPDISVPERRSSLVPVTVLPLKEELSPKRERTPPVRKASVKKTKKKRRSVMLSPKKAARQQPRWTFTENVTELFTGQLFRKVEANETLTPAQIEAFRRKREAAEEERQLEEEMLSERLSEEIKIATSGNDGDETPLEPFYLDDLANRIEAMLAHPAPASEPEEDGFINATPRDFSVQREPALDATDAIPIPPKNPARQRRTQMPTIPELRVTAADSKRPAPTRRRFEAYEDDDFVFLSSTPCTLTMPSFRHGPIRIKKSDLEPVFEPDNTLDWTAFQMAILGAGDFFDEGSEKYSEEAEREEILEWFEGFGFKNHGRLVTEERSEEPEPSPSTAEFSPVSSPSSCYSDEEFPIPLEAEYSAGFWDGERRLGGCGLRRWTVEGHPKKYRRPSADSLPQSPMMPINVKSREEALPEVVIGGDEVVPMGYNLGHDLGDFLRWEAENVYAVEV